jgi:histidine triad (HIT) family protein
MASVFTRIVNGEIPCYQIAESEKYLAFLDINPTAKGHTLVIPKMEVDYLFDLDSATYQGLFAFAREVALGIGAAIPCLRVGVAVLGLEVPHAHIHLVPMHSPNVDMGKKLQLEPHELTAIAEAIKAKI